MERFLRDASAMPIRHATSAGFGDPCLPAETSTPAEAADPSCLEENRFRFPAGGTRNCFCPALSPRRGRVRFGATLFARSGQSAPRERAKKTCFPHSTAGPPARISARIERRKRGQAI